MYVYIHTCIYSHTHDTHMARQAVSARHRGLQAGLPQGPQSTILLLFLLLFILLLIFVIYIYIYILLLSVEHFFFFFLLLLL